jgi:hypothetical protein
MAASRELICDCGCGFRTTIEPLLRLHEMVVKAERRTKEDAEAKNNQNEETR